MTAILELDNVTAGYSDDIDILKGLSLSVEDSGLTGIIGLNGAGKSTVMKVIMGFLTPREGRVRLDGEEITGLPAHAMFDRGVCLIPQESSLFPYMTVEDNLLLPLEHQVRRQKQRDRVRLTQRLEETYSVFPVLAEKRKAQAGDLSGGQQKTLEFAKAYALQPRLCLIDEPSIGLAPKIAKEVYGFIELFARRGTALLLIDHNIRRVAEMADTTYVLSLGSVTAKGSREDFKGRLHEQVREWLGVSI